MVAGYDALRDFGESPRAVPPNRPRSRETVQVCHTPLQDPKFFQLLELIDAEHAAQVRAGGCSCDGVLHSARYRRKPRGGPREFQSQEHWRLSFCCNCCRQRHTPRSVVYLGRRVFLAAVVVLGSAQRSRLTGRAVQSLCTTLGLSRCSLDRWRAWWQCDFPATAFWRVARARFMPGIVTSLPAGLLERFEATEAATQLREALRFLAPLSTQTEGR